MWLRSNTAVRHTALSLAIAAALTVSMAYVASAGPNGIDAIVLHTLNDPKDATPPPILAPGAVPTASLYGGNHPGTDKPPA